VVNVALSNGHYSYAPWPGVSTPFGHLQAGVVLVALLAVRIEAIGLRALLGGLVLLLRRRLFALWHHRCLLDRIAVTGRQVALRWRMARTHAKLAVTATETASRLLRLGCGQTCTEDEVEIYTC